MKVSCLTFVGKVSSTIKNFSTSSEVFYEALNSDNFLARLPYVNLPVPYRNWHITSTILILFSEYFSRGIRFNILTNSCIIQFILGILSFFSFCQKVSFAREKFFCFLIVPEIELNLSILSGSWAWKMKCVLHMLLVMLRNGPNGTFDEWGKIVIRLVLTIFLKTVLFALQFWRFHFVENQLQSQCSLGCSRKTQSGFIVYKAIVVPLP